MTFARFMELALYDPELGYYRVARTGIGRAGDFLTAPETHPIFGAAIATQAAEVWERLDRPASFTIREDGAGTGALAESILRAIRRRRPELLEATRYLPVELNGHRAAAIVERLETAGFGRNLAPGTGAEAAIVIANEFLDALPVHRVQQHGAELLEIFVDWRGDRFADQPAPPSTPLLVARLAEERISLAEGQQAEIALGVGPWFDEVGRWLGRGLVVVIDYGQPAEELYGPRHPAGTLLGYAGHRAIDDPYANVGRQDLTAHVDLTAVEHAARLSGFDLLGQTSQAEFLMGLGVEDLLEEARSDPALTMGEYVELRSGLVRLLDPRATGGFRVLLFGRDVAPEPPLRGLAFRLRGGIRA